MAGYGGMIHYELILFYQLGFRPKDVINTFGYPRGSAYRFYRIYRIAGERARNTITRRNSGSPGREQKAKKLDHLKSKKRVSPREKWEWTLEKDGTTTARKKRNENEV